VLAAIVLLPLLGFLVNGAWYLLGREKASAKAAGGLATAVIAASFLLSVASFFQLRAMEPGRRLLDELLFSWIAVGPLKIDFLLRLDPLSAVFILVITGVGALIHLYSIGYMAHDEAPGKFFAYLNLFCAMMLVLVLGGSLPVLFLGWEGVGLCSYLLISFRYTDPEKAKAGKKAFVVNRIGDLGFLLGSFLLFTLYRSFDFEVMRAAGPLMTEQGALTVACLLLFLGCTGKSAQLPLYLWLPDAMAGPTPVSALIHAATMVTSGIYLLARLSFLYLAAPTALAVIAVIGGLTAFFAATIAIAQNDIKKILAYSTISQLGYMFLACGVGAFGAGVFHVVTHAFFKALMFLGAGSVIHGMHEEQDIRKMGGLKDKMPKTYLTFAAGWLAICGIPPFSGFFSKDEILWKAFSSPVGSAALWALGAVTAVLTALYMTRLFALTFLGTGRYDSHHPPHESPASMTVPLMVLAVLSVAGGLIGIPHLNVLEHWLEHTVAAAPEGHVNPSMEWVLMAVSAGLAAITVVLGLKAYRGGNADKARSVAGPLYPGMESKWWGDELAETLVVRPIHGLSVGLWKIFDVAVLDRFVVGMGRLTRYAAETGRGVQTGSVQVYSFVLLLGLIATVGFLLYGTL
jgi:NADH-quinone oxidoreductase subunit L